MRAILEVGRVVREVEALKGKYLYLGYLNEREVVKDVTAETLLKESIRKVKRGSLIYTDMFKSYDGLVMYGFRHERIDKSIRFSNGRVYINGIEGFWGMRKGGYRSIMAQGETLLYIILKNLSLGITTEKI
jgi:hypothetical protein